MALRGSRPYGRVGLYGGSGAKRRGAALSHCRRTSRYPTTRSSRPAWRLPSYKAVSAALCQSTHATERLIVALDFFGPGRCVGPCFLASLLHTRALCLCARTFYREGRTHSHNHEVANGERSGRVRACVRRVQYGGKSLAVRRESSSYARVRMENRFGSTLRR